MKNIQQQIDIVSRLPDDVLLMKAQRGDPSIPQWAFVTEIDDRTRARKESEANQQSQPKVADRVVQEGIAMLQPQGQPMAMQQPMQQPMQGMYAGGAVRMNEGRMSPSFYDPEKNYRTGSGIKQDSQGNYYDGFGNLVDQNEAMAILAYENDGAPVPTGRSIIDALNPFPSASAGSMLGEEKVEFLSDPEKSNSNLVAEGTVSPDIQRLVDMGSGPQDAGRINPMESRLILGPDATDLKTETSASNFNVYGQAGVPRNFDESIIGRKVANVSGALEDFNFPSIDRLGENVSSLAENTEFPSTYEIGQNVRSGVGSLINKIPGFGDYRDENLQAGMKASDALADFGLGGLNLVSGLFDEDEFQKGARYGDNTGRKFERFFDPENPDSDMDTSEQRIDLLNNLLSSKEVSTGTQGLTTEAEENAGEVISILDPTNIDINEVVNPATGNVTGEIPNVFYEDVKSDKAKDDMFSTMLMILGGSIMQNDLGGGLERAATAGAKMKADERARGEKALDRQITKDYYNQRLLDSQNTAEQLTQQRDLARQQKESQLELAALKEVGSVIAPNRIEDLRVQFEDQNKKALGLRNTDPAAYEAAFNQYKAQAIRNYASGLQPIHQKAAEQLIASLGVQSKTLRYDPKTQSVR